MTKFVALTLLMAFPALGALTSFPSGHFKGQGYWKDANGQTGSYTIELKIEGDQVQEILSFEGSEAHHHRGTVAINDHGFLTVTDNETKTVSHGYCGSVWCHLQVSAPGLTDGEETIAFVDGNIYHLGSAMINGVKTYWEDALTQQ